MSDLRDEMSVDDAYEIAGKLLAMIDRVLRMDAITPGVQAQTGIEVDGVKFIITVKVQQPEVDNHGS